MNSDFRLKVGIFKHPKIIKLRRRLGYEGAWSYLVLLEFVTLSHPDGRLNDMTHEDIGIAADYEGDADTFVSALQDVRLLDCIDGTLEIHQWKEHNGWAAGADKRSADAKRAVEVRWERDRISRGIPTEYEENTNRIRTVIQTDTNRNTPLLSSPLLTSPNQNGTDDRLSAVSKNGTKPIHPESSIGQSSSDVDFIKSTLREHPDWEFGFAKAVTDNPKSISKVKHGAKVLFNWINGDGKPAMPVPDTPPPEKPWHLKDSKEQFHTTVPRHPNDKPYRNPPMPERTP